MTDDGEREADLYRWDPPTVPELIAEMREKLAAKKPAQQEAEGSGE